MNVDLLFVTEFLVLIAGLIYLGMYIDARLSVWKTREYLDRENAAELELERQKARGFEP